MLQLSLKLLFLAMLVLVALLHTCPSRPAHQGRSKEHEMYLQTDWWGGGSPVSQRARSLPPLVAL